MYKCEECKKQFKKKYNLSRHIENVHSKLFKCEHCNAKFVNEQERNEHEINKHQLLNCQVCDYKTRYEKRIKEHYDKEHRPSYKRKQEDNEDISNKKIKHNEEVLTPPPAPPPTPPLPAPFVHPQGRFKNILFSNKYKPNPNWDILKTQAFYKKILNIELKRKLTSFEQMKFDIVFNIKFKKYKDNEEVFTSSYFRSGPQLVLHKGELEEKIDFSMQEIARREEEFIQLGSGWVYDETSNIDLHVYKYKPQRGGK